MRISCPHIFNSIFAVTSPLSTLEGDSRLRNIESCCCLIILSFHSEGPIPLHGTFRIGEQNFAFCLAVGLFEAAVDTKGTGDGLSDHNSSTRATLSLFYLCFLVLHHRLRMCWESKPKKTLKFLCKQNRMIG